MAQLNDLVVLGNTSLIGEAKFNSDIIAPQLILETATGEGGQIQLRTALNDATNSGIVIDTANGDFRVFGLPSRNGSTRTGNGTIFTIDPYDKTLSGGYSVAGTFTVNDKTYLKNNIELTSTTNKNNPWIGFKTDSTILGYVQLNGTSMGIGKDWSNSLQIDNTGNVNVPKKLTVADHIIQNGSLALGTTNVAVGHNIAMNNYSHAEGFARWTQATISTTAGDEYGGSFRFTDTSGGLTSLGIGSYFNEVYVIQGANIYRHRGGTMGASGQLILSPAPTESLSNVPAYFVAGGAIGSYSHSEGDSTLAVGDCSHSEGHFTLAAGKYSHAEGCHAEATGQNSHAEGYWTYGKGSASHAEGTYSDATGSSSHAEGYYTIGEGKYSHAEGQGTKAIGDYSHAEGDASFARGKTSHAEGEITLADAIGAHSEGRNTAAIALGAHAEGVNSIAAGIYSHVEGYYNAASGSEAHVEGAGSFAQLQLTGDANATTYTVTYAYGPWPSVNDYIIYIPSYSYSHVQKLDFQIRKITAVNQTASTITLNSTLSTTAIEDVSVNISRNRATGSCAHAEGSETLASGNNSHAEGYATSASGQNTHAEGYGTLASGNYSHAEGYGTLATGHYSHAEGNGTSASGQNAHAEGYATSASGKYSHAAGYFTSAPGDYQTVIGKYNTSDTTSAFIIGNGTSARSNAHTLDWNGNAWYAGNITAVGNLNVSNGAVYTSGNVLYGAAWNDYAEYRAQKEKIEPGYCVASTNNGEVYKTTEKFQACDGIVSDTFGFAIGETDNCKTPLAVAGRVLAYCEGNRYDYNAGDTVCAGPNGKVCKMTREEIKEYPDRIIGIVSEIPEYKEWGTGKVKVDNRIWIKVK